MVCGMPSRFSHRPLVAIRAGFAGWNLRTDFSDATASSFFVRETQ